METFSNPAYTHNVIYLFLNAKITVRNIAHKPPKNNDIYLCRKYTIYQFYYIFIILFLRTAIPIYASSMPSFKSNLNPIYTAAHCLHFYNYQFYILKTPVKKRPINNVFIKKFHGDFSELFINIIQK